MRWSFYILIFVFHKKMGLMFHISLLAAYISDPAVEDSFHIAKIESISHSNLIAHWYDTELSSQRPGFKSRCLLIVFNLFSCIFKTLSEEALKNGISNPFLSWSNSSEKIEHRFNNSWYAIQFTLVETDSALDFFLYWRCHISWISNP